MTKSALHLSADAFEQYVGKIVVVKLGGNAIVDVGLERAFADDIVAMHAAGVQPLVVHGGGPQISSMLHRLQIETTFAGGFRITTPEVMDVVRMVLVGHVQRNIVTNINRHGPLAIGMSGEDARMFTAERRVAEVGGEPFDIGQVGNVVEIDARPLRLLLDEGFIPVVTGIACGHDGMSYNVNADSAAAAVAVGLRAAKLLMLTDVPGLYADWPETASLISRVELEDLRQMLPTLHSGMIPKMEACATAVAAGVPEAHIIDGREQHIVLQALAGQSIGTVVTPA